MAIASFIPLRELLSTWDHGLITAAEGDSILDRVGIADYKITEADGKTVAALTVVFADELSFSIPGLDGVEAYLGAGGATTSLTVEAVIKPAFSVRLPNVTATLRLPPAILKPVQKQGETWAALTRPDGTPAPYTLSLRGGVSIDGEGNIAVSFPGGAPALALAPGMIGDSGIVIESSAITLCLSAEAELPEGAPTGFRGLFMETAKVHLPDGLTQLVPGGLTFSGCYIGTGGFTGAVDTTWSPAVSGSLFGMGFALGSVKLGFCQNAFTQSEIAGRLSLPFFDATAEVAICIAPNGTWTVELTGGLVELNKPGILTFALDSLGFGQSDGRFAVELSGIVTPSFGGLNWPAIAVRELTIDSEGNVRVPGGWLDLARQAALDLHGFQVELTRVGFGTETDGSRWIGFTGALRLVEGVAGAKVDGLKIGWDTAGHPTLSLTGVDVAFEIPEVLRFQGGLAYSETGGPRFAGQVKLNLLALGLEMDAQLVAGTDETQSPAFTYLGLYIGVDLPAGIPLWATGLGLYGLAGLLAVHYAPNKAAAAQWYEGWYKALPVGVTDLAGKWAPAPGAIALGGGLTVGTITDNGYTFSGRLLLVIATPGPVIMLEGRAGFLSKRSELSTEPVFRALAVLDGRAGTLEFGLGAQWKYDKSRGCIIDIGGDAEAAFSFTDPDAWQICLGRQEPVDKRIRALLFTFLKANSYFLLDPTRVGTGTWIGIDKHWEFGPADIRLAAYLEGNALLSWKPVQFHGDAWLHGSLGIDIYGLDFSLSANAKLAIDTPSPYRLFAALGIKIGLPWPLDDFRVSAELEWTRATYALPVPLPLAEVAVEHLKTSDAWLLPRASQVPAGRQPFLLPDYNNGEGFLKSGVAAPTAAAVEAARLAAPVVPLDCRPHLTFGRAVHDLARVGVNPQPPSPAAETVGTQTMKFSLTAIKLQKFQGGAWQTRAAAPAGPGEEPLYGSWAPVPAIPRVSDSGDAAVAQTKLWLWSINPFDYTAKSCRAWTDWFGSEYPQYPCVPPEPERTDCYDFEETAPGEKVITGQEEPGSDRPVFTWAGPPVQVVVTGAPAPVNGRTHALWFGRLAGREALQIRLRRPARGVTVLAGGLEVRATGYTAEGIAVGPVAASAKQAITLEAPAGRQLSSVSVEGTDVWFMGTCTRTRDENGVAARAGAEAHMLSELSRWSDAGAVLEPDSFYRLEICTQVEISSGATHPLTEYAFFRTQGAPGLAAYSTPVRWQGSQPFHTPLETLSPYVASTVPESGQKPVYRAYDIGVAFNETYVELMYRLAGRDLGICLYDSNGLPLRDAAGRLLVSGNAWGKGSRTLTAAMEGWADQVNGSDCAQINPQSFARTDTLSATGPKLLNPDLVHAARLVPLLLHADFAAGTAGWTAVDEPGTTGGPSVWTVVSYADGAGHTLHYLKQTSNLTDGTNDGRDPVKRGTMLVRGDATWTDYLLSATLRSGDDDAIGLVFRRRDGQNYYRFSMDRQRRYRRLVKVVNGVTTVLAEDSVPFLLDQDYQITAAAVGNVLDIFINGEPFCSVADSALAAGGIGLYCWGCTDARFADIQVQDLRAEAPAVYEFTFTTSRFANFHHQLHSYQDETWPVRAVNPAALTAALAVAATPPAGPAAPLPAESAAYEQALTAIFGSPARPLPSAVQVSRVDELVWLLESPEPIDWTRTSLAVRVAAGRYPAPGGPSGALKLTGAVSGATAAPNDETVSLVVRDSADPAGCHVEACLVPGPVAAPRRTLLLGERFVGQTIGALPGGWAVVDEGDSEGPSRWQIGREGLAQISNIWGRGQAAAFGDAGSTGTYAVAGEPGWTDYRLQAGMRSDDNDIIGVMVRYRDRNNYYLLTLDAERGRRRLIRKRNGAVTTLWEDPGAFVPGLPFTLTVDAVGERLTGYCNGSRIFSVADAGGISSGKVGLFCAGNDGARFQWLSVTEPPAGSLALFRDRFAAGDLSGWSISDESAVGGPSAWAVASDGAGVFRQTTAQRTRAIVGNGAWTNYVLSLRLASATAGSMGAFFRYVDAGNFYRFTVSTTGRQLTRCAGGVSQLIWSDGYGVAAGRPVRVTLSAVGSELRGYSDGVPVFRVTDTAHASGKIGLYCAENRGATFSSVQVWDAGRLYRSFALDESFDGAARLKLPGATAGGIGSATVWTARDEAATAAAPSAWVLGRGVLTQTSLIGGAAPSGMPTGTYVIPAVTPGADYRVSVRLQTAGPGAVGVLFRFTDAANHYRFVMDAAVPYRRLYRVVGGVPTVLWQDRVPIVQGVEYIFTADCSGDGIAGYLNGVELFRLRQPTPASGTVGLFCAGNAAATFREVRVGEADWVFLHRFGPEQLDAGTRITVHAGAAPAAAPVSDGTLHRYAAGEGETDGRRLDEASARSGVRLRLVSPSGKAEQTQTFLPVSEFGPATARILRRADGTGLLVAAAAGRALSKGVWRLAFTYRRDNTAADPKSTVLSQGGDSSSELAVIDLPWNSR